MLSNFSLKKSGFSGISLPFLSHTKSTSLPNTSHSKTRGSPSVRFWLIKCLLNPALFSFLACAGAGAGAALVAAWATGAGASAGFLFTGSDGFGAAFGAGGGFLTFFLTGATGTGSGSICLWRTLSNSSWHLVTSIPLLFNTLNEYSPSSLYEIFVNSNVDSDSVVLTTIPWVWFNLCEKKFNQKFISVKSLFINLCLHLRF